MHCSPQFYKKPRGKFCEVGKSFAVNQSGFPTENEEGDGR
jgi:hypothetical protein